MRGPPRSGWRSRPGHPLPARFGGSREGTEVAGRRAGEERLHCHPPALRVTAGSCPLMELGSRGRKQGHGTPRAVAAQPARSCLCPRPHGAHAAEGRCWTSVTRRFPLRGVRSLRASLLFPRLDSASECLLVNVLQLKNFAGLVMKEDCKM